jgi:glycosyltransferase involved in cell wall biosynthesis
MPKIVRIINRFNLGGPTYNAAYLTRYLQPEYETILVGGQKNDDEESSEFILNDLGIKPLILSEMNRKISWSNDRKAYQKIYEIIGDTKPDIVHTHASKAGALGRTAAHKLKVPAIVHTFHGNVFKGYFNPLITYFYKSIERKLASKSHAIIAISQLQKHELVFEHKICKQDKVHVIPLGFDLTRFNEYKPEKRNIFRTQYALKDDEIAIGITGRLAPIKNHTMFLTAISLLKANSQKKIKAFIIGDGETKESLIKHAYNLHLTVSTPDNIHPDADVIFTSWRKDIDVVNAGLDIVALSSDNEGTPVSLIEAQASGKPIVTTDVGGIKDIVEQNKTALIVPQGDAYAMADKLHELCKNETLRIKMSEYGWEYVKNKFHYTRLISDIKNLYRLLLS